MMLHDQYSLPNGMIVAFAPVNVSDNALPPCSNSIRPAPTSVVAASTETDCN